MLIINGQKLTYEDIWSVSNRRQEVKLGATARKKLESSRKIVDTAIREGKTVYGITTGFGAFKNTPISAGDVRKLQENLIVSHAVGVGQPLPSEIARGMMMIMANYLSKGHSGVRPIVVETLIEMLNKDVCPVVPEKGSVGSSGDLAPSSHVILVLLGKGKAEFRGKVRDGANAMKHAGITPIKLEAKEGLALINNTSCMTSIAATNLHRTHSLLDHADQVGALSAEALRATDNAFMKELHELKPYDGQIKVAARMRELLAGSSMIDTTRVQDQYSIRCMPQIHGAVREAVAYVTKVVNIEINSVTDNPLILTDEHANQHIVSGGNFHGEPVAIAMDTLAIALSELANVSDRRIASLLDAATNHGLPAFLTENGGLNSGLMILQYTTAALVSENKVLAHPSSVDSIPTSANIEDLVSMGTIGARKAGSIADNVTSTLAIEYIVACQAIDFRLKDGYRLGSGTHRRYKTIRSMVPYFETDQQYHGFIESVTNYVYES